MAGGIGSRFWPMSTEDKPKQFIDVLGTGKTLLQQAILRYKKICPLENILVVTSTKYKVLILEQCPELKESNILLEPCMRNTAPCIAYACYKIKSMNPFANIVVSPSDLWVTNEEKFVGIIEQGLYFTLKNDALLTLGIRPHRPETGYGYILSSDQQINGFDSLYKVKAFKEKPDLETAKEYLRDGRYLWNSGIFIWTINSIIKAFEIFLPEVADFFSKGECFYNTDNEQSYIDNVYPQCVNISIDYGIMEKTDDIYVKSADFGWSDLGTWGSLYEKLERDPYGNSIVGNNVKVIESESCMVHTSGKCQIVIQGLRDYIIVEQNGVFLVCKRGDEQRIKEFSK